MTLLGGAAIPASADSQQQSAPLPHEVNVREFGATGDGVTNDWAAIERAGRFLEARGGGKMYFPAGTYSMPVFGKQVIIRNNVEYVGDGFGSRLIGNNCAFTTRSGNLHFSRDAIGAYKYFPAKDIAPGDSALVVAMPADAAQFVAGDIVAAVSISNYRSEPKDTVPHYIEINRVIGVDAGTGTITLEDPIEDGWSGVKIARVTSDFSQNYSIHDLRIEATHPNGSAFYLCGSYKSVIRNCWLQGKYGVIGGNGMVRSSAHDIIANVEDISSAFEIEVGSVRANIHDCDVHVQGTEFTGNPVFYTQEWSRRTSLRNIRIFAPATKIGLLFGVQGKGHLFENIYVNARRIEKMMSYWHEDALQDLGGSFRNVVTESREGYEAGWTFAGPSISNVRLKDCVSNGPAIGSDIPWIDFYKGAMHDMVFDNVQGPGVIRANMSGIEPELIDRPEVPSSMTYPLTDVIVRNSTYTRIANHRLFQSLRLQNNLRYGNGLPLPKFLSSMAILASTTPNTAILDIVVPSNANVCWGDCVKVKMVAYREAPMAGAGFVSLVVFGRSLLAVTLPASRSTQTVAIDIEISLGGNSFAQPRKWSAEGKITVGTVVQPLEPGLYDFDSAVANPIELRAWVEKPNEPITSTMSSIVYVPIENRAVGF